MKTFLRSWWLTPLVRKFYALRPCVTFHNMQSFYDRDCQPSAQPPCLMIIPCWLSATEHSIYSQLPFISGSYFLHPQYEDDTCWADATRDSTWIALIMPTCAAPLAPPPPSTSPTDVPVSHLAKREKSVWMSGSDVSTFAYNSFWS
jgi:hypothetical protein